MAGSVTESAGMLGNQAAERAGTKGLETTGMFFWANTHEESAPALLPLSHGSLDLDSLGRELGYPGLDLGKEKDLGLCDSPGDKGEGEAGSRRAFARHRGQLRAEQLVSAS